MARRKEHSHDEIRTMAVEAAMALLQQQGTQELSLRKIASQIGYVPSTLINIFGSYNYLLLAVSEATLQALMHELSEVNADNSRNKIINMAQKYAEFAHAQRQCFKLVFELQLLDSEPLPESQGQLIAGLFSLIERELALLFPNKTAEQQLQMSRVLWGGIHGLTALSLDNKLFADTASLPALLESHVTGYLQGMGYQREKSCC
ncbi:MAG: TetR/AcrR family transcriptional regulator [Shewanella xiamenensis]|uniref:TetR/AcrR family transcriptional regulator n=1 Tax=Shewanella sp. Sh95 TaxID=1689868 RepID=UPI0006DB2C19|nr:TetR/AcrR family transcriptional regulator [Shewanella sp. Sh95]KPN77202.1 TetR family transcriptional regulator [Shewanella sp. Sh95]MCD8550553.1 TetR/AcrR family transcriptional regulator [Shewanella xiamenensis]MCD8558394.1 TetR/AcrR family transcriptional regulator [Shewanella xiamenensis]